VARKSAKGVSFERHICAREQILGNVSFDEDARGVFVQFNELHATEKLVKELARILHWAAVFGPVWSDEKLIRQEAMRAFNASCELIDALASIGMLAPRHFQRLDDPFQIFDVLASLRDVLDELAGLSKRPIAKGPNSGMATDMMLWLIIKIYEKAGGRARGSWADPECTRLDGPFFRFLEAVWKVLPSDVRPKTAEAFKRRAKAYISRGIPDPVQNRPF
jgi:hypothetical protein